MPVENIGAPPGTLYYNGDQRTDRIKITLIEYNEFEFFAEEYYEHVVDKKCRSGHCKSLYYYVVSDELCVGCGACRRCCPVHAITGDKKQIHHIDPDICIRCGECIEKCSFDAITIELEPKRVTVL